MPTSQTNHSSINRVALSALAACLVLALQGCSSLNTCKASSECGSGNICSSGTCKKSCSATTDCQAGQDCRIAGSDTTASCNAVNYAQPKTGGFGTDCALFACNQGGDNPCAEGFSCRAVEKCDPYAVCSASCKTDANCPAEYFCSATVDGTTTGNSCQKTSDCAEDEFCATASNAAGVTFRICQKKMCAPRTRCSECDTDAQCRATGLQAKYVCAQDNIGGRFCAAPCNSDKDCLKPLKIQGASGSLISYGPFETCQNSVCTPITGACHGKSSVATVSGDGQVCSPCRPGLIPSDCAEGTGCIDPAGTGESFCTTNCTVRADRQPNGSYAPAEGTDTCPTGTYCRSGLPQTCGASCTAEGICTADKYYAGYTCGASPSSF